MTPSKKNSANKDDRSSDPYGVLTMLAYSGIQNLFFRNKIAPGQQQNSGCLGKKLDMEKPDSCCGGGLNALNNPGVSRFFATAKAEVTLKPSACLAVTPCSTVQLQRGPGIPLSCRQRSSPGNQER